MTNALGFAPFHVFSHLGRQEHITPLIQINLMLWHKVTEVYKS